MLLKLELDSNYSLQAIVLMLLQFLLGNQTQHLKLWELWNLTSKFAREQKYPKSPLPPTQPPKSNDDCCKLQSKNVE
jgi:hypothetical protein